LPTQLQALRSIRLAGDAHDEELREQIDALWTEMGRRGGVPKLPHKIGRPLDTLTTDANRAGINT
jgi:hypothetical protein